ncbi:MAG: hypothetical protein KGL44_10440 [Sphingomonadales bacterium]|nr:hypothetical protein [Sphingomonadales bacterium]
MQHNIARARPAVRTRRSPWMQLLSAVLVLAGGKAELLRHAERGWASATFSGTRHTLALSFTGPEAVAAGEALIDALPDHEFTIHGQLVADAAVVSVDHRLDAGPCLTVELELLLLEDG